MYGPFANEELLGKALKGSARQKVIVATKFAMRFENGVPVALDSSPAHIRWSIEGSLKRLGTDHIDLYYQHRLDPKTPIEDTVGALADLVKAGKVRYIGLSEVGPGTIRRAHGVHPVSALQTEYSLWERGLEEKILPSLRKLGIGLVAYSPVGRGFLTGKINGPQDLDPTDWRRNLPRLQPENLAQNAKLVEAVKQIASTNGCTPAQVALAWLLRQGDDIVPIPGTKRISYLEENTAAADLKLPDSAWAALDRALASYRPAGLRYPEAIMASIDTTE
jgi:aryl-alcohol dehydrogenase-like predicted oxidoreductase